MLISLIGPPQAGKKTIAEYLTERHGFRWVYVRSEDGASSSTPIPSSSSAVGSNAGTSHPGTSTSSSSSSSFSATASVPSVFPSATALLEYATAHWREDLVTVDLSRGADVRLGFDKRPWFLLVAVEAPLGVRFSRQKARGLAGGGLEEFVRRDDEALYGGGGGVSAGEEEEEEEEGGTTAGAEAEAAASTTLHLGIGELALPDAPINPRNPAAISHASASSSPHPSSSSSLYALAQQAHLRVLNPFASLSALHAHLATLDLTNSARLRPSWETYFLSLCTLASLRSNCMKRRVGAVLVRDNRVLSTGYNGTARGVRNCHEGGCPRCNGSARGGERLDECLCLHAEENALLECGRERGGAEGTVLYCNTCPCLRCAVKIVQTGVREVVYQLEYSVDHRSSEIFREAGVGFRKYQG